VAVLQAVRRRSGGWALAATAAVEAAIALLTLPDNPMQAPHAAWLPLLRALALAASLVMLTALFARARDATGGAHGAGSPLLVVQLLLVCAANVAALAHPLRTLVAQPGELAPEVSQADGPLAWFVLALSVVAVWAYARAVPGTMPVHVLGLLLLAAGVLAACTAAGGDNGRWLSLHVLTVCWAACGVVLPALCRQRQASGAALLWSVLCGGLVLVLAVRGARADPVAPWPSAAALVFVSGLALDVAATRRSAVWVFLAQWPIYLAVSLVLWHSVRPWDWATHGPLLARVNVLATGVVALAWLAARAPGAWPWPGVQVLLAVAGNIALLARPLSALLDRPGAMIPGGPAAGGPLGWVTFLAGATAAGWYYRRGIAAAPVVAAAAFGLPLGVLLACTAARLAGGGAAYQTLLMTWALLTAIALGLARHPRRLRRRQPGERARELTCVVLLAVLVLGLLFRELV
jgi:hypothetical protein